MGHAVYSRPRQRAADMFQSMHKGPRHMPEGGRYSARKVETLARYGPPGDGRRPPKCDCSPRMNPGASSGSRRSASCFIGRSDRLGRLTQASAGRDVHVLTARVSVMMAWFSSTNRFDSLCWKSSRALATRSCAAATTSLALARFLDPFLLRDSALCFRRRLGCARL